MLLYLDDEGSSPSPPSPHVSLLKQGGGQYHAEPRAAAGAGKTPFGLHSYRGLTSPAAMPSTVRSADYKGKWLCCHHQVNKVAVSRATQSTGGALKEEEKMTILRIVFPLFIYHCWFPEASLSVLLFASSNFGLWGHLIPCMRDALAAAQPLGTTICQKLNVASAHL